MKITSETPNFAQENQAIKRQKLEEGKARQVGHLLTKKCLPYYMHHFSHILNLTFSICSHFCLDP